MMAYLPMRAPPDMTPPVVPEVHMSYGQSWRVNYFPSFDGFGINPQAQTLLACKVDSIGGPTFAPGPLTNGAGVFYGGKIIGVTGYQGSDAVTNGRCAVQAQQLLRVARGLVPLRPILEFCAAYPGSTWANGGGGGLSPGCVFTASIVDGTMTVTAVASRMLALGQLLTGAGVPPSTYITGGPNPGTTGTYQAITGYLVLSGRPFTTNTGAQFTGSINNGANAGSQGNILTVEILSAGTINVGDVITSGAPAGTTIRALLTGPGGAGSTYRLLIGGVPLTFPSQTFVTTTTSWTNQQSIINSIISMLPIALHAEVEALLRARGFLTVPEPLPPLDPADYEQFDAEERPVAMAWAEAAREPPRDPDFDMALRDILGSLPRAGYLDAIFRSVGYTQGTAWNNTRATKEADMADMLSLYDAMNLPGTDTTPLKFYVGLPAATSDSVVFSDSYFGNATFCRANAPGMAGPWSGRCFPSGPAYPWQFIGIDNIHTGDYGTTRWGEIEGYVRHLVEDLGVAWTPLWRPLTGGAIVRAGQVLTVPWARPAGPDFTAGVLTWQNNPVDGIKDWPQKGFHVRRGGVELTVTPAIAGMTVQLAVSETINPGDSLEVSYAWYGPGGPAIGFVPGVGGNLVINGPSSVLYPNGWNGAAKTIDAWAWPFIETITA